MSSFKDPCKSALKDLKQVPKVIKDIMTDFLDDLDKIHSETGTVEGFKARAEEFANQRILEVSKARYEFAGDVVKAQRRKKVFMDGANQRAKERIKEGMTPGQIADVRAKAAAEAVLATISDTTDVTTGGKLSYESVQQSYQGALITEFKKIDKIEGGRDFLDDPANEGFIYKEVYELNSGRAGGVTGNAKALEVAKFIQGYRKLELSIKQNAGVYVSEAKGFVMSRKYTADMLKANFADKQDFINRIGALINRKESFSGSRDVDASLGGMYDDILKGKDTRYSELFPDEIKESIDPRLNASRRLSNKYNKSRKLVFDSGDAEFEAMKLMSEDTLSDSIKESIVSTSKAMAQVSVFGTNPELGFKNLRRFAEEAFPGTEAKLRNRLDSADAMFEAMKGQSPAESLTNRFTNGYVAWHVMKGLGTAIVSSISDLPMAVGTIKSRTGKNVIGASAELVQDFLKNFFDSNGRREAAEMFQMAMENEMGHLMGSLTGASGGSPMKISKYAQVVLDATLFTRQIFSARHSVAAGMARAVASGAKEGNFSVALTKHLESYGFNSNRRKLLALGMEKVKTFGGEADMVTVRALEANLKELGDLSGFKEAEGFKGSDAKFLAEVVNNYRSFLNDIAQIGSPNKTLRDGVVLRLGLGKDSPALAALQLATLFKGFSLAFPKKISHIVKGVPENMNKTFLDAATTKSGVQYISSLVAGLTAMGVLNETIRMGITGKTWDLEDLEENPEKVAKIIWKAGINSGAFGLYGSALSSMFEKGIAQGSFEFVAGPTGRDVLNAAGAIEKSWKEGVKAANDEQEWGEASKVAFSEALVLGAKQLPNVWWGGALLKNSIMDAVQNQLDPEAGDRRRQNLEKYDEEAGKRPILNGGE